MNLISRSLLVVLTVVVAGFLSVSSPSRPGAAPRPVTIAEAPFYSAAGAYIASQQGFWKAEDLDVRILSFPGGAQINEAVLSGGADFGIVGTSPAIALASRNAKIEVVAGLAYIDETAPPELLVVRKDSPVTDVKQLDGKRVAVHSKGTGSHVMLVAIERRFGVKFTLLEIPAPTQWAALSRGDIDAAMTETPFPEQMKAFGARYVYGLPNKDVVPYFMINVLVTRRELAEKDPELVKRVVKVMMRTARWVMDQPEAARTLITTRLKYSPEVTKLVHPLSFKWSRNAEQMMPSVRWWGHQLETLNLIQRQPNYEQYFVTRHIEAALAELGRVPDPDYLKALALPLKTP